MMLCGVLGASCGVEKERAGSAIDSLEGLEIAADTESMLGNTEIPRPELLDVLRTSLFLSGNLRSSSELADLLLLDPVGVPASFRYRSRNESPCGCSGDVSGVYSSNVPNCSRPGF